MRSGVDAEVDGVVGAVGDVNGFEAFYEERYDPIFRAVALSIGDAQAAADCTQEAMVRAWRRWQQVAGLGNRSGWVYRTAMNLARSRFRKLRREVLGVFGDRRQPPPSPPDPALAEALSGLPDGQRQVVVLRFYLDWSLERTAETLEVAVGTVKSRQHRALARLRDVLEDTDGS